jgi:GNAT superfamily N-acetyltransferase
LGALPQIMSENDLGLRPSSVEVAPTDPRSPDAQLCLQRYFEELASRFPEGFDGHTDDAPGLEEFAPPGGCLLIVSRGGEPIACGALRTLEPGIGEIKRMWVSARARGQGIGRRLLAELERVARERHMRAVRLDTHRALGEALRLYRSSGYREIAPFNTNPYAHHWFEKTL